MKTKLFTLLFIAIASIGKMFADGVEIDGLYYTLYATQKLAYVTYKSCSTDGLNYRYNIGWRIEDAIIPSSVKYNNITYSVVSIENSAFEGCKNLKNVSIPNSVTWIGLNAFEDCSSLTSLTLPNNITEIHYRTFAGCTSLTSVFIPNSVTEIGESAFSNCKGLTSVTISNSVKSIKENAFFYCTGLTSVTIPNSVTWLAQEAFARCTGLTSVTIGGSSDMLMLSLVFYKCSNLTSVTMQSENPPSIHNDIFTGCEKLTSIYVPCGTMSAYKKVWSAYASLIKYAPLPYFLNVEVNDANAGSVSYPQGNLYVCNNSVTIRAIPKKGYHFVQWSDGNNKNPRTITITQDTTLTAMFAADLSGFYNTTTTTTPQKVLREGKVLILREGKTYTVQGHEVK